ncbi:hypothetical protein ACE14D_08275, partial [Streptomyces sp. Act-28]
DQRDRVPLELLRIPPAAVALASHLALLPLEPHVPVSRCPTSRGSFTFDLLQIDGQELLHAPYGERRARLEELFTDRGLSAPWTLCPETTDPATAKEWLTSWTQVPGVEGLVIRGSGQRYLPGARARSVDRTRLASAGVPSGGF